MITLSLTDDERPVDATFSLSIGDAESMLEDIQNGKTRVTFELDESKLNEFERELSGTLDMYDQINDR